MKKTSKLILFFIIITAISGCKSTGTYRVTFDPSIDNLYIQSAWISYTAPIRADMFQFNKKNPKSDYITPYHVEINARYNLMDFYLHVKNEQGIYDTYIEELIIIRNSGKLDEYVFFSFNPGNWLNNRGFDESSYQEWIEENMPGHIPLTLAYVEKID